MVPRHCASLRQRLHAVLLAALCSVMFLGAGILPDRALVPYPPELVGLQRAEAIAQGNYDPDEVEHGNLCMGDKYGQSLAWDRIMQDRLRAGELPLWTKDIAGGASFVPQMAQLYQPWNLLLLLVPSTQCYGIWFFLHQVLLGLFAYLFFRRIGSGHESALLGLVVAVLGLWTQCKLHHGTIVSAALPLFPMLSCIHQLARQGGGRRSVAWLALWTGLSWTSGFVIVSLQAGYLAIGFALLLCLGNARGQRLGPLSRCALGMALGGALSTAHTVPVLLAAAESARAALAPDELLNRALEWDYLLTLCWPDLFHWAADAIHPPPSMTRPAWTTLCCLQQPADVSGINWVECTFAPGLAALGATVLAFGDRRHRRLAWFFGLAALFAFALAAATTPVLQLGQLLPGLTINDLKRNVFAVAACLAVLTALGADRLTERRTPRLAVWLAGVVGVLSLAASTWLLLAGPTDLIDVTARLITMDVHDPRIAAIQGDALPTIRRWIESASLPAEPQANLDALRLTFLRATFVSACLLAIQLLLRGRTRLWAMIVLCSFELLHIGRGPSVAVAPARVTTPPAVVAPVLAAAAEAPGVRPRFQRLGEPTNVFDLYAPNLPGCHHIEDLAAYNPLPPARMRQILAAIEPPAPPTGHVGFQDDLVTWFRRTESLTHPLCDLLGVRFVLADRPVDLPGIVDRTPAGTPTPYRLYERTTCLPRATFVTAVELLPEVERRLRTLALRTRDPARTVILEDPTAPRPTAATTDAEVTILDHRDEQVRILVHCDAAGYLRLADPYDLGWTAHVDGVPTPVYAADHYLRAVYLEPGRHEVVFAFDAPRVLWPLRISVTVLLTLITLLLTAGRRKGARGRWHRPPECEHGSLPSTPDS